MKIKKVKWNSHPILGDLELDFSKSDGTPYNNILFAGENGTGKTTILETLSTFLNRGSFEYFEYIEYTANGRTYRAVQPYNPSSVKNFFDRIDDTGARVPIRSDRNNNVEKIETDNSDLRHYGCVFSRARADYKTKNIASTTTKALDIDKYDIDDEDDFTSLKQLIVDVENQDNAAYAEINKRSGTNPTPWNTFFPTSRIYRFKTAFDNFFTSLKYYKVTDEKMQKAILFTKNTNTISIDSLSTGEKQIVFRGIYLLRNNKKLGGAAIMIDEPELSMHPKWQKKILNYYQQLFIEAGVQKTQLFFATHSEHVLKCALDDKGNNLVIVLKDNNGTITPRRIVAPSVLPTITDAETNYLAFDLPSNDYHIELYGHLQNKESKNTVKTCDIHIKSHPSFDPTIHSKASANPGGTTYDTLSTYIRNAIDHPEPGKTFSEEELRTSIELLILLCK